MAGKKRKKKRTRSRSGKQARQRERDGADVGSPARIVDEEVEEAQSTVEMGSLLTVSTAVPTIPTLPPVKMEPNDSNPWQSLKASVVSLVDKLLDPFRGIFSLDIEEEGTEAYEETEEDTEYAELLTQMHGLYDQLFREGLSDTERGVLGGRLEQLEQRRVKLQEARSSKTT